MLILYFCVIILNASCLPQLIYVSLQNIQITYVYACLFMQLCIVLCEYVFTSDSKRDNLFLLSHYNNFNVYKNSLITIVFCFILTKLITSIFFGEISLITVKINDTKVFQSFPGIFLYVNVWQLVSMNVIRDVEIDVIVGLEIANKHCLTFYCNAPPCNQKYWQKQKKTIHRLSEKCQKYLIFFLYPHAFYSLVIASLMFQYHKQ